MTKEEFSGLKRGDVVQSKTLGNYYVVVSNYGEGGSIAVDAKLMTDPLSWELISQSRHKAIRVDLTLKDDFVRDQIREAIAELKAEWDKRYGQRAPDYNH